MSCLDWLDLITLDDPSVSTKPISESGVRTIEDRPPQAPSVHGAVNGQEGALIGDFRANFRMNRPDIHQPCSVACVDVGFTTKD